MGGIGFYKEFGTTCVHKWGQIPILQPTVWVKIMCTSTCRWAQDSKDSLSQCLSLPSFLPPALSLSLSFFLFLSLHVMLFNTHHWTEPCPHLAYFCLPSLYLRIILCSPITGSYPHLVEYCARRMHRLYIWCPPIPSSPPGSWPRDSKSCPWSPRRTRSCTSCARGRHGRPCSPQG